MVADPALPGDGEAADADEVHVGAGGVPGAEQGGHHRGGEDREDPRRLRDRGEAAGAPVLSDNITKILVCLTDIIEINIMCSVLFYQRISRCYMRHVSHQALVQ